MKRFYITLVVFWLMAFSALAAAEPQTRSQFVGILSAEPAMSAMLAELEIDAGKWEEARKTIDEGKASLEKRLKPALGAAKGKADLIRAIKEYYLAAKAYFDGVWPSSDTPKLVYKAQAARLKSEMQSKADALELELQLSGLK
jgi:hypothetical protein